MNSNCLILFSLEVSIINLFNCIVREINFNAYLFHFPIYLNSHSIFKLKDMLISYKKFELPSILSKVVLL